MTERVIFGALVGATIGFGVGYLGGRAGGTCPILCNPYIAAGFGLLLGGLFAGSGPSMSVRDYTPSPHLMEVRSREDFENRILGADRAVLVEFGRPGCRFCRKLEPTMHELADQYEGRAGVAKLDTTEVPEVARHYEVSAVPALFLFKDGELIERMVGYREKDALEALLQEHASEPARQDVAEEGSPI